MSTRGRGLRWPLAKRLVVTLTLVLTLVAVCLVLYGANSPPGRTTANRPPSAVASSVIPSPKAAAGRDAALAASFDQLRSELGSELGLAYAPVGAPDDVHALGTWSSGPAWSTIKIPLSIARMRELGGATNESIQAAVTASDNQAAESVWEQLGDPLTAAEKVREVLAAYGDPDTEVQSEVIRPGFSAFGQTQWSLMAQVRFLARIACDERDKPVVDLMGQIVSGQRWGIGTIDGAKFKGGWGPELNGGYLARQYGLLDTGGGQVVVAIAAATPGGLGEAAAELGQVANWISEHLGSLRGGRCRGG